jgi:hypothetical protein
MLAIQEQAAEKHQKGIQSYRNGQIDQALMWLGEALSQEETSERWNDWASIQVAAGHAEDAEAGFRKALKLHPENYQACANLGALLAAQGKDQDAIRMLERSQPGLDEEGKSSVSKILVQCRARATAGAQTAPSGADQTLLRIAKTLSLQTSALNAITMRLLAIESGMGKIVQALSQPTYEKPACEGILPRIKASEIIPEPTAVDVLGHDSAFEKISVEELRLLIDLVRVTKPRNVFQFGTAAGRTTLNIAANCSETSHVYTLESPRDHLGEEFKNTAFDNRITQLAGDSRTFDFSPYFGSMDFIFMGWSHEYELVLSDSHNALKLLRNGKGTIVWHGYIPSCKGALEALDQMFQTEPKLGGMRLIEGMSIVYAWVA